MHGLLADHHGRVWVITEGGLSRYRYLTDDFVNYRHNIGDCWTIAETRREIYDIEVRYHLFRNAIQFISQNKIRRFMLMSISPSIEDLGKAGETQ